MSVDAVMSGVRKDAFKVKVTWAVPVTALPVFNLKREGSAIIKQIEDITLVVISYEIYQTSLRRV